MWIALCMFKHSFSMNLKKNHWVSNVSQEVKVLVAQACQPKICAWTHNGRGEWISEIVFWRLQMCAIIVAKWYMRTHRAINNHF